MRARGGDNAAPLNKDLPMPELPEVETVRRGLAPHLEGARLTRVIARRPDLRIPLPQDFGQRLTGRTVTALTRRSKYLLATLDDGTVLIAHLGMSGRFTVTGEGIAARPGAFFHASVAAGTGEPGPHDHVIFETEAGARIVYTDPRRFGLMTLTTAAALDGHPLIQALGIEPLDPLLTPAYLAAAFAGRRSPLKAGLLDQGVIAGLGNIYVCEALYRAGLSPRRMCHTVGPGRATRLVAAIRAVIEEAIEAGGSSLRDYAQADGALGYFQHRFRVYDREGAVCPDHGCGPVRRIVQSNRSTFFCPGCQR